MRIVNSADSITVGLISFPKNTIIIAKQGKDGISISVPGANNPIIVTQWTEFTNEFNVKYATIDDVVNDLLRSHNSNLQGNDQIKIDQVSDLVCYIGYSKPGTLTSEAYWSILKITSTSTSTPSTTIFEWAASFKNRTNIWDNRTGLNYVS